MKMNKNIKCILSSILCICLLMGAVITMVSCNSDKNEEQPTDAVGTDGVGEQSKQGEQIDVVVFKGEVKKGTKITAENIEVVKMTDTSVPLNAIKDSSKVVGKYLTADVFKGDFAFAGKLSEKVPVFASAGTSKDKNSAYISVADYVNPGMDAADAIQDLIDENPGRTLYFPDGEYMISKPLVTSADPKKAVSFDLSSYAVLRASDDFSGGAILRLGAFDFGADYIDTSVVGGIFDGNGVTGGISVEGGRNIFISRVSVKNATVGVHVAEYSSGKANADFENMNITGCDDDRSVGIKVEADGNAFTNIHIDLAVTGVDVTGYKNVFRNVYATYNGRSNSSVAFNDKATDNTYDMCTSTNYAIGYKLIPSSKSLFYACLADWTADSGVTDNHAFVSTGAFNGNIDSCVANFSKASAHNAFLVCTGGTGKVKYPIIKGYSILDNKTFESFLGGTKRIDKQ